MVAVVFDNSGDDDGDSDGAADKYVDEGEDYDDNAKGNNDHGGNDNI